MIYYIKHFFSYVIISVLSVVIFGAFLVSHPEYPGGAAGMAPLLIILNCIIAACIAFILLLLLRIKTKITLPASTTMFALFYFLVLIFYFDSNPLEKGDAMARNINIWGYLCLLLSYVLFNLGLAVRRAYHSKESFLKE
ncbi:hypothetical protein MH928_16575 [Flavobacterium sp. WW92]|uniref:hypothetical protein n=1 Tax=unclassified Flavobacterium TaxID=196869 RepID=UPI0022246E9B|nr:MULTISPECIES: hypothetical protein [unclassified Flavobacterium]WDO12924.1 hypothetical protein MH928_16575 [Flavobacterium sp. WW92]